MSVLSLKLALHTTISVTAYYPALVLFEQSNCTDWLHFCYIHCTFTDQNIAFLVPGSCRATVRNGNCIRADLTEDTIKIN